MAGVDSGKLSDVLCESFKEGASVLQRAALKLSTIPPTSPCRWRASKFEREGQLEAKRGVNVGQRDGQGGRHSKDKRPLRVESPLELSIAIVPDWCEVGRVVVVRVVSKGEGDQEREPCEVGHGGIGTPLPLISNSVEPFL